MPSEPSTVVVPEVLWLNTVTPTTFNSAPSNEHRSMVAVRAQHYSTKKREAQGALLLELQRHGEHLPAAVSPAPFGVLGRVSTFENCDILQKVAMLIPWTASYRQWNCQTPANKVKSMSIAVTQGGHRRIVIEKDANESTDHNVPQTRANFSKFFLSKGKGPRWPCLSKEETVTRLSQLQFR